MIFFFFLESKNRSLLEAEIYFNIETRIYCFRQFIILTQFLSFK